MPNPSHSAEATRALRIVELSVAYGDQKVLNGASLSLPHGRMTVLEGANGSGKSTLLKAVMGIVPPSSGEVWLEDQILNYLPVHRRARLGLGYLPQFGRVFPGLTVRENLEAARARGMPATNSSADPLELVPEIRDLLDRPAGMLSGGEQTLVGLAVLASSAPRWLLLDEPTAGLAPGLSRTIWARLERLLDSVVAGILAVVHEASQSWLLSGDRYCLADGRIRTRGAI